MFKKVLIANRGEPAVRVVRACRDLGIPAVALYEPEDRGALYVHLADEAYLVEPPASYRDPDLVIALARQSGADAVHPGYGYLAEHLEFTRTCEGEGIVVIGPGSACLELTTNKIAALERVRQAGFSTVTTSSRAFTPDEADALHAEAERLGYPVIVKPWSGGRGRGTQLVREPARLLEVVREAAAAAQAVFGNPRVYLEVAVLPSRYIEVPLLADNYGALVHMGERDSTIQRNKRKVIAEAPAPGLTPAQRATVRGAAVEIARLFGCRGACTVEFVVDADGQYYFTEVKPRLQVEHPATEMVTRIDAVREQIRLAAGQPLGFSQDDVRIAGAAFLCRINAEDPWRDYLPSPGRIGMLRVPGGPNVRVDTYAFSGAEVSVRYESLFAKLAVWGANREEALHRLRRALAEFAVTGINTNISMLRQMVSDPDFIAGAYDSSFSHRRLEPAARPDSESLRDLAAVAALAFLARVQAARPITPPDFTTGWHRDSRRLPQ